MVTFFTKLELAERCFTQEALYYLAFNRLPESFYTLDGREMRFDSYEHAGAFEEKPFGELISETECNFAGLPLNPSYLHSINDTGVPSVAFLDDLCARYPSEDVADRQRQLATRETAIAQEEEQAKWDDACERYLEFHRSRLFLALCEGTLRCQGKLLNSRNRADAEIEAEETELIENCFEDIRPALLQGGGLNWAGSFIINDKGAAVFLSLSTRELLSFHPPVKDRQISVWTSGENIFSDEESPDSKVTKSRGRPSFDWADFHVEVATLIAASKMPQKKEAAIQYFMEWFKREKGFSPQRSTLGEKLKPYFDKLKQTEKP